MAAARAQLQRLQQRCQHGGSLSAEEGFWLIRQLYESEARLAVHGSNVAQRLAWRTAKTKTGPSTNKQEAKAERATCECRIVDVFASVIAAFSNESHLKSGFRKRLASLTYELYYLSLTLYDVGEMYYE